MRGECGFRLIHQVESRTFEGLEKAEEAFSVGLRMQAPASEARPPAVFAVIFVRFCSEVEKAFGTEEITGQGAAVTFYQPYSVVEFGIVVIGRKPVIDCAPFRIIAVCYGYGFQKAAFSCRVFPDKECDILLKSKAFQACEGRNIPQIRVLRDLFPVHGQSSDKPVFYHDLLCGGGGGEENGAGEGFDADRGRCGRGSADWAEGAVVEGGEDFLIRPVEQGFPLALAADGAAVVGVLAGKEEDERDAGEEGEDDYGSDKSSHGDSPFSQAAVSAGLDDLFSGSF